MWQVLQSLDAAVHIDEAARQVIKPAFETLGRINAGMTAGEQRSERLTFWANPRVYSYQMKGEKLCLLLQSHLIKEQSLHIYSWVVWNDVAHTYRNVNTVLWGDDKGNCTATTVYSVITGVCKPFDSPHPLLYKVKFLAGRTQSLSLSWTVVKYTLSLTLALACVQFWSLFSFFHNTKRQFWSHNAILMLQTVLALIPPPGPGRKACWVSSLLAVSKPSLLHNAACLALQQAKPLLPNNTLPILDQTWGL